jgi:hypothetical protein
LTKPFSSVSHKAGEGVPYETVLKTESNSEQILPTEADVVVLGTVYHNFIHYIVFCIIVNCFLTIIE